MRHFIPFTNALAEQGWGRLENYRVVSQSPAPGRSLHAGGAVTVTLDRPTFTGPLASMAVPAGHPMYASVPDLIGLDHQQAMAAGQGWSTGIFVRVGRTGPLSAAAQRRTVARNGDDHARDPGAETDEIARRRKSPHHHFRGSVELKGGSSARPSGSNGTGTYAKRRHRARIAGAPVSFLEFVGSVNTKCPARLPVAAA
jgi:hypothetical protein